MGGIAGIMSLSKKPVDPDSVERMSQALAHRGPDEEGFHLSADQTFALGTRRLALVSSGEEGWAPHSNEMRDVWLGFDGEIYNHRALRHGLELDGHRFRSACDAEVAVHAYEQQGPKFLHHLQGMFALSLWDDAKKRLMLARDRLGEKPLYYARRGDRLYFASELRALVGALPGEMQLDARALSYFLTFGCVPSPFTLFAGIRKLGAGEALVAERGHGVAVQRWWAPFDDARRISAIRELPSERHAANLRTLIECSVADRLAGAQNVAVWLSGGLASNCLAMMATQLAGRSVDALTVAFPDAPECDELEFARMTARRLASRLHVVALDEERALAELPAIGAHLDEPLADPMGLVSWHAAKRCRGEGLSIALAGLGADEILLGHDSYRTVRRLRPWVGLLRPLPFGLRARIAPSLLALGGAPDAPAMAGRLARGEPPFLTTETFFDDTEKQALSSPAWRELLGRWPASSALSRAVGSGGPADLALADLHLRVPELLLAGQDRLAMAHGIEVRSPFLDHQLVDYALAVPPGRRTGRDFERRVLSEALAGAVPDVLVRRPAQARAVPIDRWLRGGFGELLDQRLQGGRLVADGIIDGVAGRALLARHRAGTQPGQAGRLWTLLVLAEWYEAFSHVTKPLHAAEPARIMDAAE